MILTITLSPCVDKSTRTTQLQPESKLRCTEVLHEAGGGGINVSKALYKLGVANLALFPAGGHNGNMLRQLLEEQGIAFHALDTRVETRENWVVLEENANQQFRFTFPGRAVEEAVVIKLIHHIKHFTPSIVVASGSLPVGLSTDFYQHVIEAAQTVGARAIIDTSGEALKSLRGKGAFLIKPNISELSNMVGETRLQRKEVVEAARQAVTDGFAEVVVVSLGAEGACLVTDHEHHFIAAPKVERKSTVGAGDSMVAGMAYRLQQQRPFKEVLAQGVACGSAATMNHGTKLFETEDAQRLFEEIMATQS